LSPSADLASSLPPRALEDPAPAIPSTGKLFLVQRQVFLGKPTGQGALFAYKIRDRQIRQLLSQKEKPMMKTASPAKMQELKQSQRAPLNTPTDLPAAATTDIAGAMNAILADVFALYLKTKNFHWHLSGPHFRDYHLMFDEQADQIFAMTDPIAERVRKIGGSTIKSIAHIARLQRVLDNDADYVDPEDMLAELCEDNKALTGRLRAAHDVCEEHGDIATTSLIEVWIDETERRTWFLFESSRRGMTGGH
jgi:starvation-inducible DNA-binding protein